jgi:hypothetical protein
LVREQHDEAVHAHAHATGRRHAVLERSQEVLVDLLCLVVTGRPQARLAQKGAGP